MLYPRSVPMRYFTPQEANELLPLVRAYLLKVREHAEALRHLERAIDDCSDALERDELENIRADRELGQSHLLERLGELGAELMEPVELGMVRFPAMRNGEPVWLVWLVGEAKVARWARIGPPLFGFRARDEEAASVRWEWRN